MISVNSDSMSLLVRRSLNKSTNCVNIALERMTTGYKVNCAKDDAANLLISQRLTTQINGTKTLNKGVSTALDMLASLEGALNGITQSLQRIRDLSLQKMNGVYDANAIASMDAEIQQQILNIEQTSNGITFNGKHLLDGTAGKMFTPIYDKGSELSGIDMSAVFGLLQSVDVLLGKKDLFFVNASPNSNYFAEFDNVIYQIQNHSANSQQIIYNYNHITKDINFIEGTDVSAIKYGTYDNSFTQLGNGEKYINLRANETVYIQSDNKVFELKNTNATSQIAIYKDNGAGDISIVSGNGIQKTEKYSLDSYTTNLGSGKQSIGLSAGETTHLIFNNKLYEISSTKAQTLIYQNTGGNLSIVAGNDGVTVTTVGAMSSTTALTANDGYLELSAGEVKYYELNGEIFKLQNTRSTQQTIVINKRNANGIVSNSGNITRTKVSSTSFEDLSSFANPYKIDVTAGQTYRIKSADKTKFFELTALETGFVILDFDGNNIRNQKGAALNITTTFSQDITLNPQNQFDLSVSAHSEKTITIGTEIYTVKNDSDSDFTKHFAYDSVNKKITEMKAGTYSTRIGDTIRTAGSGSGFISPVTQMNEEDAIAAGYTLIKTAADLDNIRNNLSGKYMLMGDIDLSSFDNWDPIGEDTNSFSGTFDGNGYTISNLKIDRLSENNVGLFGQAEGATIKNVGLENVDVKGVREVGGLLGHSIDSNIANSYTTGTISGAFGVGGLVGTNARSHITNSYSTSTVSGSLGTGGLVGYNLADSTITNSYATGAVSGMNETGGLVGVGDHSSITNSYATGAVSGTNQIGGLVGEIGNNSSISNSYATGAVTGTNPIGGLVGENYSDSSITNSFWDTETTGQSYGIGLNDQTDPTKTTITGLTSAEMADPQAFKDAGWDEAIWDFSTAPPTLKTYSPTPPPPPFVPIEGTYVADTMTPSALPPTNNLYLENFSGTSYVKLGDSIYEIKNTSGTPKDILFDYDSITGTLAAVNAPDIQITKNSEAAFGAITANDMSIVLNAGQTQYITVNLSGVNKTFKITNNYGDKQTIILSKNGANLVTKSGQNLNIEQYTDMRTATAVANKDFYVDFAGETKKNISINGRFYEITNNAGTTALFSISGANIVQKAANNTTNTNKLETLANNTTTAQKYIELNANETQFIKIDGSSFELKNLINNSQTQIFTNTATTITNISTNTTAQNLVMTNDPMQQMLIKIDWSLTEVLDRLSAIGSYANVLNAAILRNDNLKENLVSAQSTIMDADIAEESAKMVQNQILQSVSATLLAQVNTMKRDLVLSLIR